jgi:hypothetical protein
MRASTVAFAGALLLAACGPKPTATSAPASGATASPPGRVELSAVPQALLITAQLGKKTNSRYDNALAAAYAPADKSSYTEFSEYGWRAAVTDPKSELFLKYGPMPAGYWVYAAPYWVVWNLKNGKTGP